jgi:hypothetical protein
MGLENILSCTVKMYFLKLGASKLPAYSFMFIQEPEEQTEA